MESKPAFSEGYTAAARILVVDDMATNRALVRMVLQPPTYEVLEATDGDEALAVLERETVDAVLLDILMPKKDGFEVCRHIREEMNEHLLPIIMITSLGTPDDVVRGMEMGASDYVTKPFHAAELLARVRAAVEHKRLTDRLDDAESVLFALARVVEARDGTTGDHCDRLSHQALVLGRALGLPYEDLEALRRGGILHDIGKVAIPDAILLKPGRLSEDEWAVMRHHPTIGANLCRELRTMQRTVEVVRHHHEKWNGSGYPTGLKGEQIPLLARVFQIVDVYDALSTERPYKPALDRDRVVQVLEDETARGFWDPGIMGVFLDILQRRAGTMELPERREKGRDQEIFEIVHRFGAAGREDRR